MTENKVFPIRKHELVKAPVKNINATTFKFLNNEYLKGRPIVGVTFHPASYLTKGDLNETLVPTNISIPNGFLTLKTTTGIEVLNKIPLYLLAAGVTPGGTYEKVFPIDRHDIDWEQSYITMAAGGLTTLDNVFLISVWYEDGKACVPQS